MWGGSFPGPFRAGVEETIAETVDELVERTGGKDLPELRRPTWRYSTPGIAEPASAGD